MSENLSSQSREDVAAVAPLQGRVDDRLARRRALLGGVRLGAAALTAAAAPIKSHAGGLLGDHACTLSGQLSAAVSARPSAVINCQGYMPSHYFNATEIANDPKTPFERRNWPTQAATYTVFGDIFPGAGSDPNSDALADILKNYLTDDRAWWVAAYFTALQRGYPDFVYSADDVKSQYAGTFPSSYAPAPTPRDYFLFYRDTLLNMP